MTKKASSETKEFLKKAVPALGKIGKDVVGLPGVKNALGEYCVIISQI